VRFLIDHGAELTIKDHRYQSKRRGMARYGAHNERMADFGGGCGGPQWRERVTVDPEVKPAPKDGAEATPSSC